MNALQNLPPLTRAILASNALKGCTFASIEYVSKTSGEHAKHLVNMGASYDNAKQKDIAMLDKLTIEQAGGIALFNLDKNVDAVTLFNVARLELLNSCKNPDEARSQAQINAYTKINSSMKYHNVNGSIYIYALTVSKQVITAGTYKTVNSRPLTKAKDIIRKLMKCTQYRQFIINPEEYAESASFMGETINFDRKVPTAETAN